jgi:hypothetical protein
MRTKIWKFGMPYDVRAELVSALQLTVKHILP